MVGTSDVRSLATMWQRIPPPYSNGIANRTPMSYALLTMPPEALLHAQGVTDDLSVWGENRDHPYAKWQTFQFSKGMSLADALVSVERKNRATKRLLKVRLSFVDGVTLTLSRSNPSDAHSLLSSAYYDPQQIFSGVTAPRRTESRHSYVAKNKFLADDKGHVITGVSTEGSLRSEKLYRDCPPPDASQPGYSFTPVSHLSFLQRPNSKVTGVRPSMNSTNDQAVQYRPRAFLRASSPHHSTHSNCAEVHNMGAALVDLSATASSIDHRNRLSPVRQR